MFPQLKCFVRRVEIGVIVRHAPPGLLDAGEVLPAVVDRNHRPDYIFNDSNDGWFGAFGPPQHLAQARLRAVEEGLPILRATTTGISAVIDSHGVVRQHLPMHQAGRLDGVIPPAAQPTPFSRLGNILPLGWALLVLLLALVAMRRSAR